MSARSASETRPLPHEFLDWQVRLRAWTAEARAGSPHIGVAPVLVVRMPGIEPGITGHGVVCGLLPRADQLERKTEEFRSLYEGGIGRGARHVYDRGLEYLRGYYRTTDDFDPESITTLLPEDAAVVDALRADPRCGLLFHVFEPRSDAPGAPVRCQLLEGVAEVHAAGPVYENVWWHNALFHGFADGHVVLQFRHQRTLDVRFGALSEVVEEGSAAA